MSTSKIVINQPSVGVSPSGFSRVHVEMSPRDVAHLIGYDPRVLIMKPQKSKTARGSRDIVPHNISMEIVALQNSIQRSVDNDRVAHMVDYLLGAMERKQFADWGAIELVTTSKPDVHDPQNVALNADANYFIADGQHRYCALLDFTREYPQYASRFTQAITISVLPENKLAEWAGQEFHDRNYYSVPVRTGKALSVDTRNPVNALAKGLVEHPVIAGAGGIAFDRDAILSTDLRFSTHSVIHRFVRGFLFGRAGLDSGHDESDIPENAKEHLWEYLNALGSVLPWTDENRDVYLTRTSVVLSALAVLGNDMYSNGSTMSDKIVYFNALRNQNWLRTNLDFVGVVGSEKHGLVQPASSRQAIDATIRFLRERIS